MTDSFHERLLERARELKDGGLDWSQASSLAWLEERVRQWPAAWGNSLHVLIFGDFEAPDSPLVYPSLGISISPEKQENTIISGPQTVLEATVDVPEKSLTALLDAARRINLLLGTQTLHQWGNVGYGWWSWVTHEGSGGIVEHLAFDGIDRSVEVILRFPPEVRKKLEAALFWIREPRNFLADSYRVNDLRMFSSYWNAFECLVDAICILRPRESPSKLEKQAQIERFFQDRNGEITVQSISDCYRSIIDPGFRAKAAHALCVCFGDEGKRYYDHCFAQSDRQNRLYDIRNAINHGSIDAENPEELLRVSSRWGLLWMIVWRMFGCLIPFPAPVDPESAK